MTSRKSVIFHYHVFRCFIRPASVGYLNQTKPIMNTATKVIAFEYAQAEENSASKSLTMKKKFNRLVVHGFDCIEIIKFSEILYLHGEGNYCNIVKTNGDKILSSKTLKFFQEKLPANTFFRTHKSYIVNLQYVSRIHKKPITELELNGIVRIPASRANKSKIFNLFS